MTSTPNDPIGAAPESGFLGFLFRLVLLVAVVGGIYYMLLNSPPSSVSLGAPADCREMLDAALRRTHGAGLYDRAPECKAEFAAIVSRLNDPYTVRGNAIAFQNTTVSLVGVLVERRDARYDSVDLTIPTVTLAATGGRQGWRRTLFFGTAEQADAAFQQISDGIAAASK